MLIIFLKEFIIIQLIIRLEMNLIKVIMLFYENANIEILKILTKTQRKIEIYLEIQLN